MYGVVNQAVRKMVIEKFGEETWEKIRARACTDDVFIGMDPYDDSITYGLVKSACEELGAEPADVLKTFGDYWIDYIAETYADIFLMTGSTFFEFVSNLNNMHTRVSQILPGFTPPSFKVTDIDSGSFKLHYKSVREGLCPMLFGLINGVGRYFNTDVEVTHLCGSEQGLDHDELLVKFAPRALPA